MRFGSALCTATCSQLCYCRITCKDVRLRALYRFFLLRLGKPVPYFRAFLEAVEREASRLDRSGGSPCDAVCGRLSSTPSADQPLRLSQLPPLIPERPAARRRTLRAVVVGAAVLVIPLGVVRTVGVVEAPRRLGLANEKEREGDEELHHLALVTAFNGASRRARSQMS